MVYVVKRHEDKVLKLKKALCGLKQAPRAWNSCIDKYFQENGSTRCKNKYVLYKMKLNENLLLVCIYVDDLIFIGNNPSMFQDFKNDLSKEFDMTDIGLMAYYLGIEINKWRMEFSFLNKPMQKTCSRSLT